jgi:redox-sensitive bicupin YhaK (pirin superfamily)
MRRPVSQEEIMAINRPLERIIPSIAASDGAGVSLRRSLGQDAASRVDPFLMLDAFSSADPDDYIAGFPPHPHRGFETVTYMLDGHMRHEDSLGHRGELRGGGAQWMIAGRGIVHSEMPQQEAGRMRGFQLWINLPARDKMCPAGYRDIQADEIPVADLPGGGRAKVVAGRFRAGSVAVDGPAGGGATQPLYADIALPAGGRLTVDPPEGHAVFLYPYDGGLIVDPEGTARRLEADRAGVLGPDGSVAVAAADGAVRFLLVAGRPLGEPVVQHGPFVMNTVAEIEQAVADYRAGTLGRD